MYLHRMKIAVAFWLCLSFLACGPSTPPGNGNGEEVDTTPPTLASSSPADDQTGVRAEATVTLVFSEEMDRASVEAALDTSELGEVMLSWNASGDTLTITPDAALAYATGTGTDPDTVDANIYTVVLASTAADLAGNAIGAESEITFSTLKEMSAAFDLDDDLTNSLTAVAQAVGPDVLLVGDYSTNVGIRTVVTFDLESLPPTSVEITSAIFATRQLIGEQTGLPYGDGDEDEGLGEAVLIDHVIFSALDNAAFNSSQTALRQIGEFCVEGQVVIEVDVTAEVEDDRVNRTSREDRSQFLLRFALDNDDDDNHDIVVISRDLAELTVTYLAP